MYKRCAYLISNINKATCKSYLAALLLIFLEFFIVYSFSNFPFLLTALEDVNQVNIFDSFINVLESELSKGQLSTFVCTLIAPVFFWALVEFKKNIISKIFIFLSLIPFAFSIYLQGKHIEFKFFTSLDLYITAIVVWLLYLVAYRLPPERKDYQEISDEQTNGFVNKTKKIR